MPASKEQQWKPEEDQTLKDCLKSGMILPEISEYIPTRTKRAIQCRMGKLELKANNPRTFHSKDESFWETPNSINSYYAGVIAADGSLSNKAYTLAWACESTDRPHLEDFVKRTRFTGGIKEFLKQSPKSDYIAIHNSVRVSACKKWNADLAFNFNIVGNKTYRLSPPNLANDYLMCCFLIGYTDGDGTISPFRTKAKPEIHIRYCSASRCIIEWIRDFVIKHFPFQIKGRDSKVHISANGQHFSYSIYGVRAIQFFEFMRKLDLPKFPRKWDNPEILAVVERYHRDFPQWFTPDQERVFDAAGMIVPAIEVKRAA